MARVVHWDEGGWGIAVEYEDGSWRKYFVGSRREANDELAHFTFEKAERLASQSSL